MVTDRINICGIPATIWGEKSEKVFLAVHGNMSNKEDTVIRLLAEAAAQHGYQTISFDLPEHGERTAEGTPCKVQYCVQDLRKIMDFTRNRWTQVSLFACSMGAFFSLLEYHNEPLNQSLFLSPVVDMQRIISNLMTWFDVSEEQLKSRQEIQTPIGQTLYWDYYCYVREHPIQKWDSQTFILYGENDNLCERETINSFVHRFGCQLAVVESGEHYFHTHQQLADFSAWAKQNIC
ncbi:alpha/beta hydrolase [Clostridium minihomine]|uniref:alpha/beta hydrolase n=1 Tax=Clostridium minihomine TaxID=2045012 RepID=UPI000C756912|nr:alpha/beta hydrolase [Clostridium minihomine]